MVIMLFNIFCINVNAQTPHINFTPDAAGNRVQRTYSPSRMMNPKDTAQNDPKAEQIAAQYGINVYPNPLMDGSNVTVAVSSANKEGEAATVYVLDNTGKILFSQKQNTSSPSQVDLSTYAAGIYYIKVAIKKEQLFYRVVKAK